MIGTLIAAFQQITGINAVIMFSPDMFKAAGIESDVALANSMLVGFVNFLMTIVALWLVDSKGRKTLLLWGAVGMTISLAYLTYEFSKQTQNPLGVLASLLIYISFFAASFAPVMWWVFAIFGIFSIIAFVFVKIWIPETKGKSLEKIQKEMNL
ncbi:hypothetical protein Lal_00014595 [Lupinus albus]|nr:hypothetical protein Lal_00014595 [Lupinus albus]